MNALSQRLLNIRLQAVRDLAWCCFSAPLMCHLEGYNTLIFPDNSLSTWDWLAQVERDPTPLLTHLARLNNSRLGLYYEALWHFYFLNHPDWELLAYNQQINNLGVTQGAFDFLCRRDTDYFHIETAVKLYLRHPDLNPTSKAWSTWLGPNSSDRLDIKLKHLARHQLPLSQTPAGAEFLQREFPHVTRWQSALCLQGYLFYPANTCHPYQSPISCHPDHTACHWLYARDFLAKLDATQKQFWQPLVRHHWLSPTRIDDQLALLSATELSALVETQCKQEKRPLLLAALGEINGSWREIKRLFLVPDNWPHTA